MNRSIRIQRFSLRLLLWAALSITALTAGGFALSRSAAAATPAITLTSDAFPGKIYALEIIQNQQGTIQGMIYQTDTGSTPVSVSNLEKSPQPLYQQSGYEVITLSSESDFDAQKGGHIDLRFLTNALFGSYKDFRILVDVQGDGVVLRSDPSVADDHSDRNPYTGVFNALFFKKTHFGISKVTPSTN